MLYLKTQSGLYRKNACSFVIRKHHIAVEKLLFILVLLMAGTATAQQYMARHFTVQDGLAHDNVYCIFQDRRGFLWFGTDYGLSVYNGAAFNNVFTDKDGLLNSSLTSIYEQSDTMYINSYKNGLLQLYGSQVSKYGLNSGEFPTFPLNTILEKENIWVVSKPWLYKIKDHSIARMTIADRYGRDVVFTHVVNANGDLLVCSSNGLYHVTDTIVQPYLPAMVSDTVVDVCKEKNGLCWVGCRHKVQKILDGNIVKEYPLAQNQIVKDMLADSHGNLWIALDGEGVLLIKDGSLLDITHSLPTGKTVVNSMLEDQEGNIWLATYGAGVFKISSLDIMSYQPAGDNPNIFCKALCGYGGGKILIGSMGKISLWEKGRISPFAFRTLKNDQYIYFIRVVDDHIYVGTSQGLMIKDVHTQMEHTVKIDTFYAAISICRTRAGKVLVGDYTRLYELENDKLTPCEYAGELQAPRYNAMCSDRAGNTWIGTNKGILMAGSDNHAWLVYKKGVHVNDVLADARDRKWFATDNGLLCCENGVFRAFTAEQGLSSNKCNALLEHNDQLWVGTLMGLSIVDLNTLHITRFTTALNTDDILSLYCDSNTIFAGTINKLVSVHTSNTKVVNDPPPVYITYARTSKLKIDMPVVLDLPYNENKLSVGFIGLSYQAPGSVEYRYKIDGLYDSWYTTKNTAIELSALPPGDYTFVLNARKNDGPWSKDVTLQIHIATPFWKTWWFAAMVGLAVVFILFAAIRYREVGKRRQLLLYNRIVYLKQQALSALINPHFIFNCMNSIQYYLDSNENDKANIYLADFAHLIRMTLEDAQKVFISLEKEIERIKLYLSLEQLRFGKDLEYDISIDSSIDVASVFLPNMILQPYIENAIWHGLMPRKGNGIIKVSFMPHRQNEIRILITDNGVGINYSKEQDGQDKGHYGMSLTRERLKLLQQISDEHYTVEANPVSNAQGEVAGTRVVIIVTVHSSDISLSSFENEYK